MNKFYLILVSTLTLIILILSLTLYNYISSNESESNLFIEINDIEKGAIEQISKSLSIYPEKIKIISVEENSKNCWIVMYDLSNASAKNTDYIGIQGVTVRYIKGEGYYLQFTRWGEFINPDYQQ